MISISYKFEPRFAVEEKFKNYHDFNEIGIGPFFERTSSLPSEVQTGFIFSPVLIKGEL